MLPTRNVVNNWLQLAKWIPNLKDTDITHFYNLEVFNNFTCELPPKFSGYSMIMMNANEPRHEKTCLRGLRPGKTQTGLLSYRS